MVVAGRTMAPGDAHERRVAAVMVTHDHDVLHHCDRVLEMVDGRLGDVQD